MGSPTLPGPLVPLMLAAIILLPGCAAEVVEPAPAGPPTASAPASPTPTVEPTADSDVGPASRLGLECADLMPAALVADTVAGSLAAVSFAGVRQPATPLSYAVELLGGTACAGTDPAAPVPVDGTGASVPGYTVLVLPDAAEQYARYADLYPDVVSGDDAAYGDSAGVACFGRGGESSCTASILVGSTWIEVGLTGIDADVSLSDSDVAARVAPLIDSIVAQVAGAPAPAPLGVIPADTVALPDDCTAYASAEDVRTVLGRTEDLWVGPAGGGGWSLQAGAWTLSGAQRCSWLVADSDIGVLSVEALPGAAWAFDASVRPATAAGTGDEMIEPIPGIDRASSGCTPSPARCTLDTVIGGNWVQFTAELLPEGDPGVLAERLGRLATAAAARLAG